MQLIRGGTVNKVGLTNKGVEWWCAKVGPFLNFKKYKLAGSIFGTREELVVMAEKLNHFDFVALEVNPSCPNSGHALQTAQQVIDDVKAVKAVSRHPIIVKVSVDQDYLTIADGLRGVAQGISLNSVPWKTVFPNGERSPLWRLEKKVGGGGGGVSGEPAQKHNWAAVAALANRRTPGYRTERYGVADLDRVRRSAHEPSASGQSTCGHPANQRGLSSKIKIHGMHRTFLCGGSERTRRIFFFLPSWYSHPGQQTFSQPNTGECPMTYALNLDEARAQAWAYQNFDKKLNGWLIPYSLLEPHDHLRDPDETGS